MGSKKTNWKEDIKWEFSPAGPADDEEGSIPLGQHIFRGGLFTDLAKETIQNVLDARDESIPEEEPVKVVFEKMYLESDDIPCADQLVDVISWSCKELNKKGNNQAEEIISLEKAKEYLSKKDRIPILKISDYNTVGLLDENFTKLVRSNGLNKKSDDANGSYGLGKNAITKVSNLHTTLFSSKTVKGNYVFQGKTELTAFYNKDSVKFRGKGLFGKLMDNDIKPLTDEDDVPECFRRDKAGTDLYLLGFFPNEKWINELMFGILNNYFYSFYKGYLEVVVRDRESNTEICINSDSVDNLIKEYEKTFKNNYADNVDKIKFFAPKFWRVLMDQKAHEIIVSDFQATENKKGKGEIIFRFLMDEDINDKEVLEMRSSGMVIQEDTFRGIPPFNGILIVTGKGRENENEEGNILKLLRKAESPAHNEWKESHVKDEKLRKTVRKALQDIKNFIRETVKEQVESTAGESIDAYGLSRIIPDTVPDGDKRHTEKAVKDFTPKEAVLHKYGKNKKRPNKSGKNKESNSNRVVLKDICTPYDSANQAYRISFVPSKDIKNLSLTPKIIGEDDSDYEVNVSSAYLNGRECKIEEESRICLEDLKKDDQVSVQVKLEDQGKYSLKVEYHVQN